jgi:hypothetical protein
VLPDRRGLPGPLTRRRDGGDGGTRDETSWTWWTLPPAIAGCLAPEVLPAPPVPSYPCWTRRNARSCSGVTSTCGMSALSYPAAQVRTGLMIRRWWQRALLSHLQVSEALASRSAILWRTNDRSRCQPVLAGSAPARSRPVSSLERLRLGPMRISSRAVQCALERARQVQDLGAGHDLHPADRKTKGGIVPPRCGMHRGHGR